ncbi:MAG: serine hydrolase domain-containing protein [Gaiellaceae bacterium]
MGWQPLPELAVELDRLLRTAQRERRIPSVSAAVFRDGEIIWSDALGLADVETGEGATPDHAYRIGSITKTFTAVCVMQLRDAGQVDLGAPLRTYIPEVPPGPTVQQALAHLSGFQREPPGEIWETLTPPSREELLAGLEDAEQVLAPGTVWHYSNLAFSLLGELVVRVSESDYPEYLETKVLEPLGLSRTALRPIDPVARGYDVGPWSDEAKREPDLELTETTAALGQLWSTTADLALWGSFLAAGHKDVLPQATLDEMTRVQAIVDNAAWTIGWGLGLTLYRRGDRVFTGHGGAMPGYLAGLVVDRSERTGAVVLAGASTGARTEELALDLAGAALDLAEPDVGVWQPDAGAPDDLAPLLGTWWVEGNEHVIRYRTGRLEVELVGGPAGRSVSVLTQEEPGRFRIVEGREQGELVRVVRDAGGPIVKLYFATYPMTREPSSFRP